MPSIPFTEQLELSLEYKDRQLQQTYKPDFVCFDQIGIRVVSKLTDERRAQVHNYLRATDRKLGLLVNFVRERTA